MAYGITEAETVTVDIATWDKHTPWVGEVGETVNLKSYMSRHLFVSSARTCVVGLEFESFVHQEGVASDRRHRRPYRSQCAHNSLTSAG
jgi:hypothetical protein